MGRISLDDHYQYSPAPPLLPPPAPHLGLSRILKPYRPSVVLASPNPMETTLLTVVKACVPAQSHNFYYNRPACPRCLPNVAWKTCSNSKPIPLAAQIILLLLYGGRLLKVVPSTYHTMSDAKCPTLPGSPLVAFSCHDGSPHSILIPAKQHIMIGLREAGLWVRPGQAATGAGGS